MVYVIYTKIVIVRYIIVYMHSLQIIGLYINTFT